MKRTKPRHHFHASSKIPSDFSDYYVGALFLKLNDFNITNPVRVALIYC